MSQLNLEQKFHFNVLAQRACETAGIPQMRVSYNVKGGVGGTCDVAQNTINLNEHMAVQNFKDFNNIIVHEVAHMVDYVRNGKAFRRNKRGRIFHDKVFYSIMQEMIDKLAEEFQNLGTPSRCHQFSTKGLKGTRKQRRWAYYCGCLDYTHKIATVTHNRMQGLGKSSTRQHRICNKCESRLLFTGRELK